MSGTTGIGGSPFDTGKLQKYRYTDRSFPLGRDRQGIFDKPDFDFTRLGLLFPQNDPTETVSIIDQMDHRKAFGTPLHLHVHYIQETAEIPIFIAEYAFYNNGDDVPGSRILISTADAAGAIFPWSGNPMLQIIAFPDIPAPANENISANLDLVVYRDDNVVSGDVLTKYIDYHYAMDDDGSRQEFVK